MQQANAAVLAAVGELLLPDGLHTEFAGDAKSMTGSGSEQGLLIILALLAVYIVLGVLYESFIHPVSYTHLDVYKRQHHHQTGRCQCD